MVPETTLTESSGALSLPERFSLPLRAPRFLIAVGANGRLRSPLYPKSMNPVPRRHCREPGHRESREARILYGNWKERIYCCLAIDAGTSFPPREKLSSERPNVKISQIYRSRARTHLIRYFVRRVYCTKIIAR